MKKIIIMIIGISLFSEAAVCQGMNLSNSDTTVSQYADISTNSERYYGVMSNKLEVPSPGILVNDNYISTPTIRIINQPNEGSIVINNDGSFSYTPATGFVGTDSFEYMINTTEGASNRSTVSLNIFNNSNYNPIQIVTQKNPISGLKHPGLLLNAEEIRAMGGALLAGDVIKDKYFTSMEKSTRGRWTKENWKLSSYDLEGITWNSKVKDAGAGAIRYALAWIMKRDKTSEQYAIGILNEWAKVNSFTPSTTDKLRHHRLVGGMFFGYLAHAAEMLIYSGSSWPKDEQEAFKNTVRGIFLPIVRDDRAFAFNGNWDAAATWSVLSFAVLLDDKELFDKNIEYLKHGDTNTRIEHYLLANGQNAETARDQVHSHMGTLFLALSAQVAWSQDIDLYEYNDRSIGKAYEYQALYNLGEDNIAFQFWPNPLHASGSAIQNKSMIPSESKRGLDAIYEMVYHHYKTYRNIELPHSKEVLEAHTRAEGAWARGSNWSSASYYNLDLSLEASIRNTKKVNDITINTSLPNKLVFLICWS